MSKQFGVSFLVTVGEGLQPSETLTCFGSCKPRVTEPHQIECICLLKLETSNLITQFNGIFVEVMIVLEICAESPVVEEGGLDNEGGECWRLRPHELDEPVGKNVWVGLNRDDGVSEKGMEEYPLVLSSEGAGHILTPFEVLNKGGLNRLPVCSVDNEVGEAAIVSLIALGAFSVSDEGCECGGVVACSYVGKLLVEGFHLLMPHPLGEGLLGLDCLEVDLSLI